MSNKFRSALLAGALLISSQLRAEDTDPEAKAVRDAGKAYASALTSGDKDAMHACLSATDGEKAVADSMFDMMQAAKTFREAVVKQFGDDAMKSEKGDFSATKLLNEMDKMQCKVTGDDAILFKDTNGGITFKKTGGAWKITSVTGNKKASEVMPVMLGAATKATNDISADVAAGKYKSVDEVKKDVDLRTKAAIMLAMRQAASIPTTKPAQ